MPLFDLILGQTSFLPKIIFFTSLLGPNFVSALRAADYDAGLYPGLIAVKAMAAFGAGNGIVG